MSTPKIYHISFVLGDFYRLIKKSQIKVSAKSKDSLYAALHQFRYLEGWLDAISDEEDKLENMIKLETLKKENK